MARYILLEVDDNEAAGDLVAAIQSNNAVFFYKHSPSAEEPEQYVVEKLGGARARALMAKPVNFCECLVRDAESVRGRKLGWYVCAKCAKPKRGICQHPRNLLDPIDMPVSERDMYLGVWEGGKPINHQGMIHKGNPDYRGKRDFK